jgi:hypothetical protein
VSTTSETQRTQHPSVWCDVISVVTEFMALQHNEQPHPSVWCDVISVVTEFMALQHNEHSILQYGVTSSVW